MTASDGHLRHWKGRVSGLAPYGDNARSAKLNSEVVREIKSTPLRGPGGVSNVEFARRLGVHPHTISDIRNGKTWSHVRVETSHAAVGPEEDEL